MVYSRLNKAILFKTLMICFASMVFSYLLISKHLVIFSIIFLVLIIIGVINLILYVNKTNRKIAFYFDAIENEDTSLKYREDVDNPSLKKLHTSLNRINNLISDIKRKNMIRESFYSELIEHSATGLLIIDDKGYVEIFNRAALKYLNMTYIRNIILLEQMNFELYEVIKALNQGEKRNVKIENETGVFQVSVSVSLIKFNDRQYRLVSMQDIKHEMDVSELEAWQKLTKVLTHEIMNSITPLTSMADTLLRFVSYKSDLSATATIAPESFGEIVKGLEIIKDRGKNLLAFTNDYRKFIKPPIPSVSKINVNDFINKAKMLLAPGKTDKKHQIKYARINPPEFFKFDPEQLLQVLINLVNNAIESIESIAQGNIDICFFSREEHLCINVTDNGPGIPHGELDKVFIPFYTTKPHGTGIGLSISKQIILGHNGKLSVASQPYVQTTFSIEL
jgi:two-component system nitrogen regulation sensor histidine kinase NtrY